MTDPSTPLAQVAVEIEAFVGQSGWDQRPALFALVPSEAMGTPDAVAGAYTAVAQDELPDGPLDEVLAGIAWPDGVEGCALAQEIVVLPPGAEGADDIVDAAEAARHPQRQEARLVAAVLGRDSEVLLRLRDGDLLTGDLAPNLVAALHATLA